MSYWYYQWEVGDDPFNNDLVVRMFVENLTKSMTSPSKIFPTFLDFGFRFYLIRPSHCPRQGVVIFFFGIMVTNVVKSCSTISFKSNPSSFCLGCGGHLSWLLPMPNAYFTTKIEFPFLPRNNLVFLTTKYGQLRGPSLCGHSSYLDSYIWVGGFFDRVKRRKISIQVSCVCVCVCFKFFGLDAVQNFEITIFVIHDC